MDWRSGCRWLSPRTATGRCARSGATALPGWWRPAPASLVATTAGRNCSSEGGELTWRAGPLAKGASLCHGTAGNGYAFLKLLDRTGDELWLDRSRRFAMHAIEQVERLRTEHGQGRYALWTGDLGTATLHLRRRLDAASTVP